MQPERREQCTRHDTELKEIKDLVTKIFVLVNGNGKIGLAGKVDVLWNVCLWMAIGVTGTMGLFIWEMIKK